jgi:hypothetical protein
VINISAGGLLEQNETFLPVLASLRTALDSTIEENRIKNGCLMGCCAVLSGRC